MQFRPSEGLFVGPQVQRRAMLLSRDFAKARKIIQKSLTLDSCKFVDFIQTFGPLENFSYYLVLVFCNNNKILKFLVFFLGK